MMNDTRCGYAADRDETLVAYLYDDITSTERSSFEAHLAKCARCRGELDELRSVRQRLTRWTPPVRGVGSRESVVESRRGWWREMPAWAQVAAALLVLGVSAAVANLNVHYGSDGITIRTGWTRAARDAGDVARGFSRAGSGTGTDAQLKLRATEADAAAATDARLKPRATDAPWRDDLAALERQLRTELRSSAAAARPVGVRTGSSNDDEIVRRVRALIAESERRQQRELALQIAGVLNDVNVGRAADLARIKQTLGALENTTGAELFKQRQQMVNYLNQVSLKR